MILTWSVCLAWPGIFSHWLKILKVQTLNAEQQVTGTQWSHRWLLSLVGDEGCIHDRSSWSNSLKSSLTNSHLSKSVWFLFLDLHFRPGAFHLLPPECWKSNVPSVWSLQITQMPLLTKVLLGWFFSWFLSSSSQTTLWFISLLT